MRTPDRYRKILLFLALSLSALLLFLGAVSAFLDAAVFDPAFQKQLMEKYDIYGILEKTADSAVQEYIKSMDADSQGNEEQKKQLTSLMDKAVTPEMVRLNADTLIEGLMDYFSGNTRFLPDIYLKPVNASQAAAPSEALTEASTDLPNPSFAGIDRISLNVILMYMDRNDTINLLSEIRLFKFVLSHAPAFLLLFSLFLLVPVPFLSGRSKPGKHIFRVISFSGFLSVLSGLLILLLSRLYISVYLSSSSLSGYIGKDALSGYIGSFMEHSALYLAVCGAALAAVGWLIRLIPWGKLPSLLHIPERYMQRYGKTAAALLLLVLLLGLSLAGFEAMKGDFHAKDLSAAFERLRSANTYSTVIAARDEIIYAVEVRATDGQTGDPVQGVPVIIGGKLKAGEKDYNVSGSSDESGKVRFDIEEGSFRLEFDSALFPEGYKIPASYDFEIKTAGIAIITVRLDKAEVRKAGIAEVLVLGNDNKPAANLELAAEELATDGISGTASGKVYSFTNADGTAIFKLPEGKYKVSFVESVFPQQFILPEPIEIETNGDDTVSYSLKLALKAPPTKAANN